MCLGVGHAAFRPSGRSARCARRGRTSLRRWGGPGSRPELTGKPPSPGPLLCRESVDVVPPNRRLERVRDRRRPRGRVPGTGPGQQGPPHLCCHPGRDVPTRSDDAGWAGRCPREPCRSSCSQMPRNTRGTRTSGTPQSPTPSSVPCPGAPTKAGSAPASGPSSTDPPARRPHGTDTSYMCARQAETGRDATTHRGRLRAAGTGGRLTSNSWLMSPIPRPAAPGSSTR